MEKQVENEIIEAKDFKVGDKAIKHVYLDGWKTRSERTTIKEVGKDYVIDGRGKKYINCNKLYLEPEDDDYYYYLFKTNEDYEKVLEYEANKEHIEKMKNVEEKMNKLAEKGRVAYCLDKKKTLEMISKEIKSQRDNQRKNIELRSIKECSYMEGLERGLKSLEEILTRSIYESDEDVKTYEDGIREMIEAIGKDLDIETADIVENLGAVNEASSKLSLRILKKYLNTYNQGGC